MGKKIKIRFCEICKHRMKNSDNVCVCGLPDKKGRYEDFCPSFDKDSYELARLVKYCKYSSAPWWKLILWFILVFGITLSSFVNVVDCMNLDYNSNVSILPFTLLGYFFVLGCMVIRAYVKKSANTISLVRTYISMVLVNVVFSLVYSIVLYNTHMIRNLVPHFLLCLFSFIYIAKSKRLEYLFPKWLRIWGYPEKVMLVVYIVLFIVNILVAGNICWDKFLNFLVNMKEMI